MTTIEDSRSAIARTAPRAGPPTGPGSLGGHVPDDAQTNLVAEGTTSLQATEAANTIGAPPAGGNASRSHTSTVAHAGNAAADDFPGGHGVSDTHGTFPAGDQVPPAAKPCTVPIPVSPLADPLLALAAEILDDLERVRIANENRLRQFTRSEDDVDADGETGRGFGLDESHPDVARLAALVGMLADAEHKATLNLQRLMRRHPLGPWVAAQKGVGEKQAARLIASIGDPYVRPEIEFADGTVEPRRPRTVSELWALCGYHVVPAGQSRGATQDGTAGGELNGGDSGHAVIDGQMPIAGVAPKRQRGQRANWSATAKMRAYLVAESCIKQRSGTYRPVYDAARAKYADAVHAAECVRCGPSGKPALPGSPLSDGHKHARALRAVAKEVLKGLWREARRIHLETPVGSHPPCGTQVIPAADGT